MNFLVEAFERCRRDSGRGTGRSVLAGSRTARPESRRWKCDHALVRRGRQPVTVRELNRSSVHERAASAVFRRVEAHALWQALKQLIAEL